MIPLAVSLGNFDAVSIVLWLLAWFVTIGLHEGGHAWVAWWLGDDTAYLLGKRSINPLRHIDWQDQRSVIATVVVPIVAVIIIGFPLGIAWVPVNPSKFKNPSADHAKVALAGPGGNVIGAVLGGLILFLGVWGLVMAEARVSLSIGEFLRNDGPVVLELLTNFGLRLLMLNVLLGVINLIPVPGVDGGAVAYHFLNPKGREIFDRLRPYGIIIFFLLLSFPLQVPLAMLFRFAGGTLPKWIIDLV